jgi:hypothetical protein
MLAVWVKRTNCKAEVECEARMHISKEDFLYRACISVFPDISMYGGWRQSQVPQFSHVL